jgi:hypothetical protein
MGHKIVEAIIEDGQLKYVNGKLPKGKIDVHLIYDTADEPLREKEMAKILAETSGIYKEIDAATEAMKLRESWERDFHK